jgi:hypothetical protein
MHFGVTTKNVAIHRVSIVAVVGWFLLRGGPTQAKETRETAPVSAGSKQVTHCAWLAPK